tara:strand:+ start:741 stop:1196 length:456 start_codon:yes stop_codon:yes gene_type:complete
MRYIAHRGNMNGPSALENHPDHIREALQAGFDVEVDVWLIDGDIWFGHNEPQYPAHITVLNNRYWLHCKNIEALRFFGGIEINEANVFWHESDDYTLTNKRFIWTNIGKDLTGRSIMVMPEVTDSTLENTLDVDCAGICSDWIQKIKVMRT